MRIYLIIAIVFVSLVMLIRINKKAIVKWLFGLRARLQLRSLRNAIVKADHEKEKTGRKNMVVFNTVGGGFEPISKRLLKTAERAGKNNSNKKMTPGRKRVVKMRGPKKKVLNMPVTEIEKKSLYVTK